MTAAARCAALTLLLAGVSSSAFAQDRPASTPAPTAPATSQIDPPAPLGTWRSWSTVHRQVRMAYGSRYIWLSQGASLWRYDTASQSMTTITQWTACRLNWPSSEALPPP